MSRGSEDASRHAKSPSLANAHLAGLVVRAEGQLIGEAARALAHAVVVITRHDARLHGMGERWSEWWGTEREPLCAECIRSGSSNRVAAWQTHVHEVLPRLLGDAAILRERGGRIRVGVKGESVNHHSMAAVTAADADAARCNSTHAAVRAGAVVVAVAAARRVLHGQQLGVRVHDAHAVVEALRGGHRPAAAAVALHGRVKEHVRGSGVGGNEQCKPANSLSRRATTSHQCEPGEKI